MRRWFFDWRRFGPTQKRLVCTSPPSRGSVNARPSRRESPCPPPSEECPRVGATEHTLVAVAGLDKLEVVVTSAGSGATAVGVGSWPGPWCCVHGSAPPQSSAQVSHTCTSPWSGCSRVVVASLEQLRNWHSGAVYSDRLMISPRGEGSPRRASGTEHAFGHRR